MTPTEKAGPKTRGLITIATGRETYYWLAWHLLQSYRYHAKDPLPFAILCDQENRYTRDFDQVILLDTAKGSYNDKLRLPEYAPFDETLFVDADTLAYADLNRCFDDFADGPDFSVYGQVMPLDTTETCWFRPDDVGEWKDKLHFCTWFQGGIYYLRRSGTLSELTALCRQIYDTYHRYHFTFFDDPCDEPIFALAMSVMDLPPVADPGGCCFLPQTHHLRCDILTGLLEYRMLWETEDLPLRTATRIHFATRMTSKRVYQREAFRLRCRIRKGHAVSAWFLLRRFPNQCRGAVRRALRKLKKKEP